MLNGQKLGFYLLSPLLAFCVFSFVVFKTDLSAFIIAGEKSESILLANEMQSGTLSRRYLVSIGSDTHGSAPKSFITRLISQLKEIDGVQDVWLPNKSKNIGKVISKVYSRHASALYSLSPDTVLSDIFSNQGLQKRAEFLSNALLSPHSSMVKKIALQDPLLLTLSGFESLNKQAKSAVNIDKNYQNLVLETSVAGLNIPQQKRIQAQINQTFGQLVQSSPTPYQLEMTGVAVFAVATQSLIQGDIMLVSILSSVALMLLFLLIFRSFSSLFQVFSVLLIVILSAMLITQLVFGYVHGMTIAIGATLVGICIDYPIHAIAHAQSVSVDKRISVIARIWPSMVLGGITTMIGYTALGISGYPGFQQVAVYACSGIIVSLLLTRFAFPRLVSNQHSHQLNLPFIKIWAAFCYRFRAYLIALLVLCFFISASGIKSLHWMQDMQELTPELDYLKIKDKRIRVRMTSIEPGRFILIVAENVEQALQKTETVYAALEALKQAGELTEYFGIYPWLLSARQQQINHHALQQYLTAENLLLWQQALTQQGLSVKKLGHFNYAFNKEITLEQVLATPVKKLIDNRIISSEKETIVMLWLADHSPHAVQAIVNTIEGVQYISQRDMLNKMTQDYTQRAQKLLLIGLGLITLLLLSRYKNLLKTIQTLLPAVLAAFFILGFWSFSGVSISFLHLVGFLLGVAICVDYGIFYQENRGGDISLTYQAMGASMLTSALAFGCLIVSESTSLKILASVVVLGVLIGFLLCPIIIKENNNNVC
ncbi:MAG: MMPL family transporter [Methylococcales symbiont of Hymedesmia sp. n. MRB-2018]|nr:MAG: MMPL family transporter [Methylococcales symbiont of Hymedesmia sp. n. MRB-2018]